MSCAFLTNPAELRKPCIHEVESRLGLLPFSERIERPASELPRRPHFRRKGRATHRVQPHTGEDGKDIRVTICKMVSD